MTPLFVKGHRRSNNDAELEAEKTLQALDSLRPVKAPPFFSTRVRARLRAETERSSAGRFTAMRVSIAVLALAALLSLNFYSMLKTSDQSADLAREQERASFAEEYNLTHNRY
jgi:hypothetical protein